MGFASQWLMLTLLTGTLAMMPTNTGFPSQTQGAAVSAPNSGIQLPDGAAKPYQPSPQPYGPVPQNTLPQSQYGTSEIWKSGAAPPSVIPFPNEAAQAPNNGPSPQLNGQNTINGGAPGMNGVASSSSGTNLPSGASLPKNNGPNNGPATQYTGPTSQSNGPTSQSNGPTSQSNGPTSQNNGPTPENIAALYASPNGIATTQVPFTSMNRVSTPTGSPFQLWKAMYSPANQAAQSFAYRQNMLNSPMLRAQSLGPSFASSSGRNLPGRSMSQINGARRPLPPVSPMVILFNTLTQMRAAKELDCKTVIEHLGLDLPKFYPVDCDDKCLPPTVCRKVASVGFCCPLFVTDRMIKMVGYFQRFKLFG